ncbi:F-box protein family-like [Panicum miliaceum]|uniref:F-box protein family-like n=1 Tax=Panicum miliaceum TaxID=4540 RepID=A0A3L6PPV5_PANMI|nr:F-box protein family-like [Panicum miliaceum]
MLDRSLHEVTIPEMQGKICLDCVHDGSWLLMLDEATSDCFLLSVASARANIPLPPLRLASEYKGTCGVLGSPSNFTVVIASHPESDDRYSLLCCRPGDGSWTDLLEGSDDAIKINADVVAYAGKLYASTTSGDDLVAIDVAGGGVVRTQLLRTGKEEALRGTHGNCVHLVWSSCDRERLYKYCLDDMTITFDQFLPEPTTPTCRAYWVVPTVIQATGFKEQALLNTVLSNQVTLPQDLEKSPEQQQEQGNYLPAWHDLPLELLESIASNLFLVDRLRFPAVCKSWSLVSNPLEQAKVWPWLMHLPKQDGVCKMFDPLRGKEYTLQVEAFETTSGDRLVYRSSKDMAGWSHQPSSHSGKYATVETWQPGEDAWSRLRLELEEPFHVAYNNPIYFRGEFYCLGRKGSLAVFIPSNKTWRALDKPEPIYAELNVFDDDHEGAKFCYLVELAGDLVSVFMRNAEEPPRVFKLDQTKMTRAGVEDIDGAALFLDYKASFGVVSPGAGNGNKIFFPRYSEDGKQAAFYDLETKMYHPASMG